MEQIVQCWRCNGTGQEDTYTDYTNPYRTCSECHGKKWIIINYQIEKPCEKCQHHKHNGACQWKHEVTYQMSLCGTDSKIERCNCVIWLNNK